MRRHAGRPRREQRARRPLLLPQPAGEGSGDRHGVVGAPEHERARCEARRRGSGRAQRGRRVLEQRAHRTAPASATALARSCAPKGPAGVTRTVTLRPRCGPASGARASRQARTAPPPAARGPGAAPRRRPPPHSPPPPEPARHQQREHRHADRKQQREQPDHLDGRLAARGAERGRSRSPPRSDRVDPRGERAARGSAMPRLITAAPRTPHAPMRARARRRPAPTAPGRSR